jgi:hypothetical protein
MPTFKANDLIDTLIPIMQEIEGYQSNFRRAYPNRTQGVWVESMSEKLQREGHLQQKAEAQISAVANVLNISEYRLYAIARTALDWYDRTNWQYCLSEETAQKIVELNAA